MAGPFGPKPVPGPLERQLALISSREERARHKARLVARLANGSHTFERDGVRITASGWRDDNGVFEVVVAASDHRGTLPVSNPYRFVNPPIKVHDGTWRRELIRRPSGQATEIDVPNMVEDAMAAAEQMILDAVVAVARGRGWRP